MIEITVEHFQLTKIAESGQCFRWQELGPDFFGIPAGGGYITARQPDDRTLLLDCTPEAYESYWRSYFGLYDNYELFYKTAAAEQGTYLYEAVKAADGVRILSQDFWETLVSFLISQNNNLPRIKKTISKMCESLGTPEYSRRGILYYKFPEPEALTDRAALRALGLGYRDKYIAELAENVRDGKINLADFKAMETPDARKALKKIMGIGDKVADCILLFGLHRLEAFPVDVWIKRIITEQYGGQFPLERYDGFAGVVQQYIFYFAQLQKTLSQVKSVRKTRKGA